MDFSINSWIYGPISIERIAELSANAGVDGLDISGEPDTIDISRTKKALTDNGLKAFCINGNYDNDDRVFCHNDKQQRAKAISYGKKCVDMAAELGAKNYLIVPSKINGTGYYSSREEDWNHAVEAIYEVAEYARKSGVTIGIECVNKYEVTLIRTLQEGIKLSEQIGLGNVKIIADTFHMNIEEVAGVHNAFRRAGGECLAHVHLGDNVREVPGKGCLNWREILMALKDINYSGALSFEPLPNRATLEEVFTGALSPVVLSKEIADSLTYLKSILRLID